MQKKVSFLDTYGNAISGVLTSPANNATALVIMCHGLYSGKNSATNLALEKIFLKNKIATFRFDFFAHGESQGRIEEGSIDKYVDDVLKAIEYVKSKGYENIGLCGASFGGIAVVIAASKTSDIAVIALKAVGMGQTSRKMQNYKKDFETKSWIEAGKKIKMPALIVHGTADKDVEVELSKELSKSIKKSKIVLIKGADHTFSGKENFEKMISIIAEFILNKIGVPSKK
jgi:uncharacterized protein